MTEELLMATQGVGQQKKTAAAGLNNVNNGQNLESQAQGIANNSLNLNGGLSSTVGKQLANESGQINRAYQGQAQASQRGLSARGMGVAPSGLSASIANTAGQNAGAAQTGAIGGAFNTQTQLNQSALNPAINAENATSNAIGQSTGANTALSQMPTMAGNIAGGLSGLAGVGTSLFGAQGMFGKGLNGGGAFGGTPSTGLGANPPSSSGM
jgi:hypothetical protein